MNIIDIEQHIKDVLQTEEPINPLLKVCIENDLNTKYIEDGCPVYREKEDIIISAINSAKMLLNNCVDSVSLNFRTVNVNRYLPTRVTLFEEWNRLIKIFSIAKEANDEDSSFFDKYSEYMTDTGERTVDYCGYTIPIDEDSDLFIEFIDFGLRSYHLINQ